MPPRGTGLAALAVESELSVLELELAAVPVGDLADGPFPTAGGVML